MVEELEKEFYEKMRLVEAMRAQPRKATREERLAVKAKIEAAEAELLKLEEEMECVAILEEDM